MPVVISRPSSYYNNFLTFQLVQVAEFGKLKRFAQFTDASASEERTQG